MKQGVSWQVRGPTFARKVEVLLQNTKPALTRERLFYYNPPSWLIRERKNLHGRARSRQIDTFMSWLPRYA